MLKIKDNVDLKELEKYGFYYHFDKRTAYYGCCVKEDKGSTFFINNARIISINSNKSIFNLETLYDLIKDGLVEKVEE